jgi:hypothetical protein
MWDRRSDLALSDSGESMEQLAVPALDQILIRIR